MIAIGLITGTKSVVIIVVIDVPPSVPPEQVASTVGGQFSVALPLQPLIRGLFSEIRDGSGAEVAKQEQQRIEGVHGKPRLV